MAGGRSRKPASRHAASPRGRTTKHTKQHARARRWSQQVAERSDALDLERGVFTSRDPRQIARSLKRSAERSTRRKAQPFQSAMSMLNLYINRAGRTLPASRRRILERAKQDSVRHSAEPDEAVGCGMRNVALLVHTSAPAGHSIVHATV
jgi:hypothetical protein